MVESLRLLPVKCSKKRRLWDLANLVAGATGVSVALAAALIVVLVAVSVFGAKPADRVAGNVDQGPAAKGRPRRRGRGQYRDVSGHD